MTVAIDAELVKDTVTDVDAVCEALGLLDGAKRQRGGLMVRCPWHDENTPSCSVQVDGGHVVAHCFACGQGGDVIALTEAALGMGFEAALEWLADRWHVEPGHSFLRGAASRPRSTPRPKTLQRGAQREHLPADEAAALWNLAATAASPEQACGGEVGEYLRGRGMAEPWPLLADMLCLWLPPGLSLPRWAALGKAPWTETGHRLIVPMYDHAGDLRGWVARDVTGRSQVKSIVPSGYRSSGLVMANVEAQDMLITAQLDAEVLVIAEGEIDFLTACGVWPKAAVIGIRSGSWSEQLAARVPSGIEVMVATDADSAGDEYARVIASSLAGRCDVERWRPKGGDLTDMLGKGMLKWRISKTLRLSTKNLCCPTRLTRPTRPTV